MPDIYDELVGDKKFVYNCGRYTKRRYFLTRGSDVKLKDTFKTICPASYCHNPEIKPSLEKLLPNWTKHKRKL